MVFTCVGRGSTRADVAAVPLLSWSWFRSPSLNTETQSQFSVNYNQLRASTDKNVKDGNETKVIAASVAVS